MVSRTKLMMLVVVVATVTACASTEKRSFDNVRLTGFGSDRPDSLCENFRLTQAQAGQFLNRVRPINARQMHDHYNYLPCFVKGTVTRIGQSHEICDLIIRAGGTVELSCEGGQTYLYACDTCDELLVDDPQLDSSSQR